MPRILDEWLGYCHRTEVVPRSAKSKEHNKWWAACLLQDNDGSFRVHTLYAGLGKKSSERIERFNERGGPLTGIEARRMYDELVQEKQSSRKGYVARQFGVPFGSPTPISIPSFSQRFASSAAWAQPAGGQIALASMPISCPACGTITPLSEGFCLNCGMALVSPSGGQQVAGPAAASQAAITQLVGPLPVGYQVKQGRYLVKEKVGEGGMGAVYKVEDQDFARRVIALKELVPDSRLNAQQVAEAAEAFKREAMLLAPLFHLGLPRIYDHFIEAGRSYLVMDFIEGKTLEDSLVQAPAHRLSLEQVLRLGIALCDVLEYLHTRQPPIIFRDLKPGNVMVDEGGHVYLIDFGIARLFKSGQQKDTTAFGSPGYAAPEQYGKSQSTPKTDLYALGATLHRALTGRDPSDLPFHFAPFPREIKRVAGLEPLIFGLVTFDVQKRNPATATEVKMALEGMLALHLRQQKPASR